MSSPKYRIYPSLLDKFQRLMDSEKEFEDFWNVDSEGEYKRSLAEIYEENEQGLLDAVNRVPHEPIEAADKGTVFNELVDCAIHQRSWEEELGAEVLPYSNPYNDTLMDSLVKVERNGFTFTYSLQLIMDAAAYFTCDATSQYRTAAILNTNYGDVELYGVVDEIVKDCVLDIKTTKSYSFPKFAHAWQKEVYPYCLVESGEMTEVKQFEYTVFKWTSRDGEPLDAELYAEVYTYSHERARAKLRSVCERLIEWLELNRSRITDTKIFGE